MKPLDLLQFTRGRLEAQRSAKAIYAERLAPDFTIFDFLDTRENGLSRVFAWLLDPTETHAQGSRFLEAFMRWLDLDDEWVRHAPDARAWLEIPTTVGTQAGFIDIVVQMHGRILAVENKPFAVDQPRQVERYLDHLAHHAVDGHCLLYLSGGGDGPSETSIRPERANREIADGTLVVRGYPELATFLQTCVGLSRAPTVTMAIEGLIAHIRKNFMDMSDVHESSNLAKTICDNPSMIDAALSILEAETELRKSILRRFDDAVRERIAGRGWHVIRWDIRDDSHTGYVVGITPDATVGFGIQFDERRYRGLFYGVASEGGRGLAETAKPSLRAMVGAETGNEWWPIWKAVDTHDRWFPLATQADREFWLAAYDGRLADMLVRFVAFGEDTLKAAGRLDDFGP